MSETKIKWSPDMSLSLKMFGNKIRKSIFKMETKVKGKNLEFPMITQYG